MHTLSVGRQRAGSKQQPAAASEQTSFASMQRRLVHFTRTLESLSLLWGRRHVRPDSADNMQYFYQLCPPAPRSPHGRLHCNSARNVACCRLTDSPLSAGARLRPWRGKQPALPPQRSQGTHTHTHTYTQARTHAESTRGFLKYHPNTFTWSQCTDSQSPCITKSTPQPGSGRLQSAQGGAESHLGAWRPAIGIRRYPSWLDTSLKERVLHCRPISTTHAPALQRRRITISLRSRHPLLRPWRQLLWTMPLRLLLVRRQHLWRHMIVV